MSAVDDALLVVFRDVIKPLADRVEALEARPLAVSSQEAARLLDVDDTTVRQWVTRGLLPRVPHLRTVRIPFVALEQFVLSGVPAVEGRVAS